MNVLLFVKINQFEMPDNKIKIIHNSEEVELPILDSTIGPSVIDIRALEAKFGYLSHDPGFISTSSCESKITFIDGKEGKLWYRGYPIEQLAENSTFEETAYLLLSGELPKKNEYDKFCFKLKEKYTVGPDYEKIIKSFNVSDHPMSILMALLSRMAAEYHNEINIKNNDYQLDSSINLVAKVPILSSLILNFVLKKDLQKPDSSLSVAQNFIKMSFPEMNDSRLEKSAKAIDLIMLLHADHEQNASTSTVRLSGSSETSPYAAIVAGISTLWGPTHGGANEAVINMLEEIKNSGNSIDSYIDMAKDKDNSFKLMGFGHRIYKNYDPRAKIIQKIVHDYLAEISAEENKPLLDIAMQLEKIALEDEYFVKRKLYPNVDFYSGILLKAMGIPQSMYTVIFALSRTVGWMSHWLEMVNDKNFKIGRPRQLYTGKDSRKYLDISSR